VFGLWSRRTSPRLSKWAIVTPAPRCPRAARLSLGWRRRVRLLRPPLQARLRRLQDLRACWTRPLMSRLIGERVDGCTRTSHSRQAHRSHSKPRSTSFGARFSARRFHRRPPPSESINVIRRAFGWWVLAEDVFARLTTPPGPPGEEPHSDPGEGPRSDIDQLLKESRLWSIGLKLDTAVRTAWRDSRLRFSVQALSA